MSHTDAHQTTKRDPDEDPEASTEKKLDQLYSLIDGIETAMMTTRTPEGALVSRPMQVQAREAGTDLWFMTVNGTGKTAEIENDSHVNLSFYKDNSREWVSVNGLARVTQNRQRIHQFYKPDWKAWLPEEGGEKNGGPDDPRIALIEVDAQSATYMKSDQPRAVKLFNVAKAMLTGTAPKLGTMGTLDNAALEQGQAREK